MKNVLKQKWPLAYGILHKCNIQFETVVASQCLASLAFKSFSVFRWRGRGVEAAKNISFLRKIHDFMRLPCIN